MPAKNLTALEVRALERRDKTVYTNLKNEVRDLKRAIRGFNGSTGLLGQAEKTSAAIEELKLGQADIKILLTGDDTKVNDEGGLKGKQRDLDKMQGIIKRFFWIITGLFLSGSIGLIFAFIQQRVVAPCP